MGSEHDLKVASLGVTVGVGWLYIYDTGILWGLGQVRQCQCYEHSDVVRTSCPERVDDNSVLMRSDFLPRRGR